MREERFEVEKKRLYFTDYYTYRNDYDDYFWPIGIMTIFFFFFVFLLLGFSDTSEGQDYLELLIIFGLFMFVIAVSVMFCFDGEYYQTRDLPEGVDEREVVWVKPVWARPGKTKGKIST